MEGKKTVLVIEDTFLIRESLCDALTIYGFEVRGCEDGASALEVAAQNDFSVIITDYHMPNMNGAEATKRLRTRFPLSIIIGVSSDDKKKDFLAAGADIFLLKPYHYAELVRLIKARIPRKPFQDIR